MKKVLGIEFGSTRIKAVLIDEKGKVLANGGFGWENSYIDGIFTYGLEEIITGLQTAYSELKRDYKEKYNEIITELDAIGISGMMHGFMAFDKDWNLLSPFKTWRNTDTKEASDKLYKTLNFNIPLRWSISHLYQAILDKKPYLDKLQYVSTLAVYVHKLLTGEFVAGVGEASGMFPIDPQTKNYDEKMLKKANGLLKLKKRKIEDYFPKVLLAGECAGKLTAFGAKLLDKEGDLLAGALFCPPEGDAGTGMVATDAVAKKTGNISVGTSCFSMVVLEKPLKKAYKEIDVVTTPCGDEVAMVHCNNCTSEINAWAKIFKEISGIEDIHTKMFTEAEKGGFDCGGVCSCNYLSGEPLTGLDSGMPIVIRTPDSEFGFSNLCRSLVYSAIATLKLGMDILTVNEGVLIDRITGHGGFFKTEGVGGKILASAINTPISVAETAGEGGAWGMAVLALYATDNSAPLSEFLKTVFNGVKVKTYDVVEEIKNGFNEYMKNFEVVLKAEKSATEFKRRQYA
ncbi:MAG: ATPase [Clostridia bacterium]|nr:ATPase [Clostridia bacterium]